MHILRNLESYMVASILTIRNYASTIMHLSRKQQSSKLIANFRLNQSAQRTSTINWIIAMLRKPSASRVTHIQANASCAKVVTFVPYLPTSTKPLKHISVKSNRCNLYCNSRCNFKLFDDTFEF